MRAGVSPRWLVRCPRTVHQRLATAFASDRTPAIGNMAGQLFAQSNAAQQAAQLTPQPVQDVVNHANDVHPDVANLLGQFYAQHKGLINTLGGVAATVALMKMKDHLAGK